MARRFPRSILIAFGALAGCQRSDDGGSDLGETGGSTGAATSTPTTTTTAGESDGGVDSTTTTTAGSESGGSTSATSTSDDDAGTEDTGAIDPGPVGEWVDITPPGMLSAIGIGASAAAPHVLYVNSFAGFPPSEGPSETAGIYKSIDAGDTWVGPIGTTFSNHDGSAFDGDNPWHSGVSWTIAVDPTTPDIVYAFCAFAGPQGPWKSSDGGDSWQYIFSDEDVSEMSADVYAIAIDPRDEAHLLLTFHSPWSGQEAAGVAESIDGGETWIRHAPAGPWGAGHYAFFLGEDDDGNPSSSTWILATQSNGYWRTMDGGESWTQIEDGYGMQHGAGAMYRASTGVLYMGATGALLRSVDNGQTWNDAGAPNNQDGYNAVIGDGVQMFVQSANTGTNTTGPLPYSVSLESDGTQWSVYNDQTFPDGPGWMVADRTHKLIFSANWDHGLWRLNTGN
ncbi:MAG TPA: hypothetical protein VG755_40245 [Nannocystaceae bacterium]|nr:hypothetical protein [Nannocystaceae bacterium]